MVDGPSGLVLKWIAGKIAGKAFESTWGAILERLRRSGLADVIERQFQADPDVKQICSGVPAVRRDVLTNDHIRELFERCAEDDCGPLGRYMLEEQLVRLSDATRDLARIDQVYEVIGRVVRDSVQTIITKDSGLLAKFIFVSQREASEERSEIMNLLLQLRDDVGELKIREPVDEQANLGGEEAFSGAATRRINYLIDENIRLSDRERAFVDEKFERWWDEIQTELALRNHDVAITKGSQLQEWLDSDGSLISPGLRSKAHVILAHLAVIAASNGINDDIDLTEANRHLLEAKAEMTDADADHQARVRALEAKLKYLSGDAATAVELLGESSSPACISTRLAILLDQSKFAEAADLASSEPFHEKWSENAVTAFVRAGRDSDGLDLLTWASENAPNEIVFQCRVAFAHSTLLRLKVGLPGGVFTPLSLTDDDRGLIETVVAELTPVVAIPLAAGRPSNGLEVDALGHICLALHILGREDQCRRHAGVLAEHRPIPLAYAHAVFRGDIPAPDKLPEMLRQDHAGAFEAEFLAALIEITRLGVQPNEVFDNARRLVPFARTDEDRDRIIGFLCDLVARDDVDRFADVVGLGDKYLSQDHPRQRFLKVEAHLRRDELEEARDILNEIEDRSDTEWLNYSAELHRLNGDHANAADDFLAAATIIPRSAPLYRAAMAAYEADRIEAMVECLEKVVKLDQTSVSAFHNLASAYGQLGEHVKAAGCLGRLAELEPDRFDYVLQQAGELALAGKMSDAIRISTALCQREPFLREAILQRATLLRMNRDRTSAFEALEKVRERFWDDVEFLAVYMGLGYEIGEDSKSAEAMRRILELQEEGTAKKQVLVSFTLDDMKKLIRSKHEARDRTNDLLLQGKRPWMLVSALGNQPLYTTWRLRTQPGAIPVSTELCAELSVFSTNSFAVRLGDDGQRSLEEIEAPGPEQRIVADYSALLSLHELGLLSEVAAFYGEVLFPDTYRQKRLTDQGHLESGQESRRIAFQDVLERCDQTGEQVAVVSSEVGQKLPLITELSDVEHAAGTFTVVDVASWLQRNGNIESAVYQHVRKIKTDTGDRVDEFDVAISSGAILLDESSIHAMHEFGCLGPLLANVATRITEQTSDHIRAEVRSFEYQRETAERHFALFDFLASDERFTSKVVDHRAAVDSTANGESTNEDDQTDRDWVIDASLLALQEHAPLLVDDRFCQMGVLNCRNKEPHAAFGTDRVLHCMHKHGALSVDRLAVAFLRLVKWRYRFLIPSVDVLLHFAVRYEGVGDPLTEIARYMHDCMRDFGLFGGQEPTDPPSSVAVRCYTRWMTLWAEFVAEIWRCEGLTPDQRQILTEWVTRECLPCPPRNMPLSGRLLLASRLDETFLVGFLMYVGEHRDLDSAKEAVDAVRSGLGIDDLAFERIVSQLISRDCHSFSERNDIRTAYQQRVFLISLIREGRITGVRSCLLANHLGILAEDQKLPVPSETLVAGMNDESHRQRPDEKGPYVFIRQSSGEGSSKQGIADFVPDYIVAPDPAVRMAAITFLKSSEDCQLSPFSRSTIARAGDNVASAAFPNWFPAACEIQDCLEADFTLQIGAFRQCLWGNLRNEIQEHWNAVLRPDVGHLCAIHEEGLSENEAIARLKGMIEPDAPSETLDRYERMCGHLPLMSPLSMGSVLTELSVSSSPEDVWDAVWCWVEQQRSVFRRYHACRAFAEHPQLIPAGRVKDFWKHAIRVLGVFSQERKDDVASRLWKIRGHLAQHYLRHLELHSPFLINEQLLCFAYWVAAQVAELIADRAASGPMTKKLLADAKRLVETTDLFWEIVRPCQRPSTARHVLLHHPAPWSYALALSLEKVSRLGIADLARRDQQLLAEVLASGCLRFDSGTGRRTNALWAYDESASRIALAVQRELTDEHARCTLQAVTQAAQNARTEFRVLQSLNGIADLDSMNQRFVASLFHTMSYTESFPLESVEGLLRSQDWYRTILSSLDAEALRDLTDCLGELQARNRGKWDILLPNAYLDTALNVEVDDDRRRALVILAIVAAATGETPALLRAQLEGRFSAFVRREIARWQQQFLDVIQWAPPNVAARLRDIISSLH